jgi:hypothetical protein
VTPTGMIRMNQARARPTSRRLLAASLCLVLAACGATKVIGPGRTVQIALSEYRVTPARLTVPAGPVTFLVHNFGRLAHNLAITRDGRIEAETAPIRPGAGAALTIYLAAGSYIIASNLFDDQTLGAYSTLIVTGR